MSSSVNMGSRRPAAMPDSGRYGENPAVEPGFLCSDGMSGGTGYFTVAPWGSYRKPKPKAKAKRRKAAPVRSSKASAVSEASA